MLSNLSIESARELAEELCRRGVAIAPVEDTPLASLVDASIHYSGDETKQPTTIEESAQSLAESTNELIPMSPVTHDTIQEVVVDNGVSLINRRLQFAKEVINPLTEKYTQLIQERMGTVAPITPEVQTIEFGEFYEHPLIRDVFNGYGLSEVEPIVTLRDIQLTEDHYIDAFNTGSPFIDAKLENIVKERGMEWLETHTRNHFNLGNELALAKPVVSEDYLEEADKNLVLHFMARSLLNKDDVLNGTERKDYELSLLRLLGRTAQNVKNVYNLKDNLEKQGTVVSPVSTESRVVVYGPNYAKYVEKGGSNTALMGYVRRKNRAVLGIESILENKASFEAIYDKEVEGKVKALRYETIRNVKQAALYCLGAIVADIPTYIYSTIHELADPNVNPQAILMGRGRCYIEDVNRLDIEDIYSYASSVITSGLLPELQLDRFYATMDKYTTPQNGMELTPKQAAYYAVLEELVEYFLSQTSLDSLKAKVV